MTNARERGIWRTLVWGTGWGDETGARRNVPVGRGGDGERGGCRLRRGRDGGEAGPIQVGLGSAVFPGVLSAAAVLDGNAKQGADIAGDVWREHGIGEEFDQFGQDRIVPRLGAEAGGGEEALAVDHREGESVGDGEDGVALRSPRARLEAGDGARIQARSIG